MTVIVFWLAALCAGAWLIQTLIAMLRCTSADLDERVERVGLSSLVALCVFLAGISAAAA